MFFSNPQHRWVHISNQTRDEVLVYAGYDSGLWAT